MNKLSHDYVVCIDASIQSSGVSIYNVETNKTYIYSYTNKIKNNLKFQTFNFEIFIEKQLGKFEDYFDKYMNISEQININIIDKINNNTIFYIEGYAFSGGGKNFNIGEFGGLLKYHFYKKGFNMISIAPSTWKKGAIGKGNANKKVVYDSMIQSNYYKELLTEFSNLGYPYKDKCFIEDIADVIAIQKYVLEIFMLE